VLDCFRDTPGSLDDRELTGALRAADAATWALLDDAEHRTTDPERPGSGWFDGAALTRAEVHQATGMVMAQARLDAPAALAALRAAAFSQERAVGEVADDVVARRLRLDRDGTWHAHHTPTDTTDTTDGTNGSRHDSTHPDGEERRPYDRFTPQPEEGGGP
jgi:hypothetical protein